MTQDGLLDALSVLDDCVRDVAEQQHELAPAIDEGGATVRMARPSIVGRPDRPCGARLGGDSIRVGVRSGRAAQDEGRDPTAGRTRCSSMAAICCMVRLTPSRSTQPAPRQLRPPRLLLRMLGVPRRTSVDEPVRVLRVTDHKTGRYRGKTTWSLAAAARRLCCIRSRSLQTTGCSGPAVIRDDRRRQRCDHPSTTSPGAPLA